MGRKRPEAPIGLEGLKRDIVEARDEQIRSKLRAIHLYEQNNTSEYVSTVFVVSDRSVLTWRKRYCLEGAEGLAQKKGAGRPPKLPPEVQDDLADAADLKNPKDFGYQTAVWTLPMLKDWLKKTHGYVLSTSAIAAILKKKGLRHKKAKVVIEGPSDEEKSLIMSGLDDILDDWGRGAALVCWDECHLNNRSEPGYGWSRTRPVCPDRPKRREKGMTVYGGLAVESGLLYTCAGTDGNALDFMEALRLFLQFMDEKGIQKTVIVLDNARVHHAKLLKEFLDDNKDRIRLFFLPPYSPELNLIERVWWLMRKEIVKNHYADTMNDRLRDYFIWALPFAKPNDRLVRLCENKYSA